MTYPPGDRSIESQAQTNIAKCINETEKSLDTQHISPLSARGSYKGRSSPPTPPPPSPFSAYSLQVSSEPEYNSTNEQQIDIDLEGLIQSRDLTLKVIGLQKLQEDFNDDSFLLDLRLKADATQNDIMVAIKDAGAF